MATASIIRPITRTNPGYIAGRFYTPLSCGISTVAAVATVGTIVHLTPFAAQDVPLPAQNLTIRVVTGGVNSVVKLAVWENDPARGLPTGTPILGSNTGQSCASNNTNATVTAAYTFPVGRVYWFGAAFGVAACTPIGISAPIVPLVALIGQASISTSLTTGLSAPFTYANDIMALDLTSATFSDLAGAVGNPLPWIGT